MKRIFLHELFLVFIFLMTACGTPLEEYQAKNEQEKEIKNLLVEFAKASNDFDTVKVASLLTDDCKIDLKGHAPLASKSEYLSSWKDSYLEEMGKCKFKNLELNINDEFAEARSDGSVGIIAQDIKFRFKMVRQNNRWMISEYSNSWPGP